MAGVEITPVAKGPALPGEIQARIGPDLPATFLLAAQRTPDRIALVERRIGAPPLRRTYRELQERSDRVARRLIADGVRPGDRIVICAPNRVAIVELLLGAWRAGAAVVPLDLRMAKATIEKIVASAGPVAVYLDPSVDPTPFAGAAVHVLDDTLGDPAVDGQPVAAGLPLAGAGDEVALPAIDPESLAEVLFTSGTTGTPKGVMLTHRAMVAASASVASLIAPVAHRGLAIIPLSHMYGQMAPLVAGWIRGSTLVFPTSVSPKAIIDALKAERITAITIVPAVADLLRSKIEQEAAARGSGARLARAQRIGRRLPFGLRRRLFRSVLAGLGGELELLTSGGARLDPQTAAFFEAMGIRVMEGYGSTEMAAIAGHTHDHRPHGKAGRLMPGVEIAFGPDGELLSRGPAIASGYWGRPDLSAEAFAGGWAHSGDAASLDPFGDLVVSGRTRDRITLPSGLKVYPAELEELLRRDPGVTDAVVLLDGDRLTGFVIGDEALDLRAVRERVNGLVAVSHRLHAVRRYPDRDFPRTHTLKVRRAEVAARIATAAGAAADTTIAAASGAATGPAATVDRESPSIGAAPNAPDPALPNPNAAFDPARAPLASDPVAALCAIAAEVADGHGLRLSATGSTVLSEAGLDSLATAQLALAVSERLGLAIDEEALAGGATIAELAGAARPIAEVEEAPDARRMEVAFGRPAMLLREVFTRLVLHPSLVLVARPRVDGRDAMERALAAIDDGRGVALYTGNHGSHLDIPLLRYALRGRIRRRLAIAAAADYFFEDRFRRALVSLAAAAFPFDRQCTPLAALRAVEAQLADGWSIALFPEGTRSRDGEIHAFRPGIGLVAAATGVPVVPYALIGAHDILPPGGRLRPGRTTVRFGQPLRAEPEEDPRAFTARLEVAVRELHRRG